MSKRNYYYWGDSDNAFLEANYLYFTDKELGIHFNKSADSVRKQRQVLSLKRDKSSMKKALAGMPIIIWTKTKG